MSTWPRPILGGPIEVAYAGPHRENRWTVLFRPILVLPQLVVLYALNIAAEVVVVIGWFGALVTGQLPEFAQTFLTGWLRWTARVWGYMFLLTDRYPPFNLDDVAGYPIRVATHRGPLNRWAVLFRIVLVLPAALLAFIVDSGAVLVLLVLWVITLVAGRPPDSLYLAMAAVNRFIVRVNGYFYLLTAEYPGALLGDPAPPVGGPGPAGPGGAVGGWSAQVAPGPPPGVGPPVGDAEPSEGAVLVGDAPAGPVTYPPPVAYPPPSAYPPPAVPYPSGPGGPTVGDPDGGGPAPVGRAGASSYGPLTYGQPPYGQAPYGQPPYGQPPYGQIPDQMVFSGPPAGRPLVLTTGAKRLVGAMVGIGLVAVVAYVAIFAAISANEVNTLDARNQIEQAYNGLIDQVQQWDTAVKACETSADQLSCVRTATSTLADEVGQTRSTIAGVTVPGSAMSQKLALLAKLGSLQSAAQRVVQAAPGPALQSALRAFVSAGNASDSAEQALDNAL